MLPSGSKEGAVMNKKYRIEIVAAILLSCIWLSPITTWADEIPETYTLSQSIAKALNDNVTFKATKDKLDQAVYVKKQARSDFLPKLSTSYGYTRLSEVTKSQPIDIVFFTIPETDQNTLDNYMWKGTVTQPLFTGFALASAYKLSKLGVDSAKTEIKLAELDLSLEVKRAYFNILIAEKGVAVVQKELDSLKSALQVAKNFHESGMVPFNDVLKAEVEYANAQQNKVKAQNDLRFAKYAFNEILSNPIRNPVEVEDILSHSSETFPYEQLVEIALKNRPEIRNINIGLEQVDQKIRYARSAYYPDVSFAYNCIKEGDTPNVSGSKFHDDFRWEMIVSARWTIWEWGKTHFSVLELKSNASELRKTKIALQDKIRIEITNALLDVDTTVENVPTTRKAVEQGEMNLQVTEEQYKGQIVTIREVLDAQAQLTRAKVNYYKALYDNNLARARLLRAIGQY